MKKNEIIIYTDGSSLGNPGPGGWGAVVSFPNGKIIELGGREESSTNNRMEMTAVIRALRLVQEKNKLGKQIKIHSDSAYVINGITMWVYGWLKNNWRTASKEPVLNQDLWEELFKLEFNLKRKYEIEWVKVAGHAGISLNERCDFIATEYAGQRRVPLFTGSQVDYKKLFEN